VDVHPLVRLGVREVLAADFEVQEAAGREEALDLVRDIGDFDVAVLDMGWRRNGEGPSISGIETIREMHRSAPVLAIVAHDARPERHLANAAIGAGATAYVARTAGPEQMRKAVKAAAAQERFVDTDLPPPPAGAPAAACRRRVDHGRGAQARPFRGDREDPHEEHSRPARSEEPQPRGRDRPAGIADRLTARVHGRADGSASVPSVSALLWRETRSRRE
jgi:CheY-like chemotaxis protein